MELNNELEIADRRYELAKTMLRTVETRQMTLAVQINQLKQTLDEIESAEQEVRGFSSRPSANQQGESDG